MSFSCIKSGIPTFEELLRQVQAIYDAFCGQLKSLQQPGLPLKLKTIVHSAEMDFIFE